MFEEIIEIEEIGEVETYDLEIDNEFHNFYANDICVSNSHSISYAYIAMQTLYLKHYYPAEFYCALLNNPKTGGSLEAQKEWMTMTIASAMAKGIAIKSPSRKSKWECRVTADNEVTLGFSLIKGIGEVAYQEMIDLLNVKGKTLDTVTLAAFFELPFSKFNKTSFTACLKAGVFDDWSLSRDYLLYLKTKKRKKKAANQMALFNVDDVQYGEKVDMSKYPPVVDAVRHEQFEEVCGFNLNFINRIAKIKQEIINKTIETGKHVDSLNNFSDNGDYYFFLSDIEYAQTKRGKEYLILKVGDGISTTRLRVFSPMSDKIKPQLQKGAVYLSQFVKNKKGFINFKPRAKFKMIVEPSGSKLLN